MSVKINVSEIFASNVFDDATMKQRLPKKIYAEFKNTLLEGKDLEPHVAESGPLKKVPHIIHTGSSL